MDKKYYLISILLLLWIFPLDLERASAEIFEEQRMYENSFLVLGNNLRIRTNPNIESEISGLLPVGIIVHSEERTRQTSTIDGKTDYWYKIRNGMAEGWCFGYYLAPLFVFLEDDRAINNFLCNDLVNVMRYIRGSELEGTNILGMYLFNVDGDYQAEVGVHYRTKNGNPVLLIWDYKPDEDPHYVQDTFISIDDVNAYDPLHYIMIHLIDLEASPPNEVLIEINNPSTNYLILLKGSGDGFKVLGQYLSLRRENLPTYYLDDVNFNSIPEIHIRERSANYYTGYEYDREKDMVQPVERNQSILSQLTPADVLRYCLMGVHTAFYYKNYYRLLCSSDHRYLKEHFNIQRPEEFAYHVMDHYDEIWKDYFDMRANRILIEQEIILENQAKLKIIADFETPQMVFQNCHIDFSLLKENNGWKFRRFTN